MDDKAAAQTQGDPLPLSERLKVLLRQRAEQEGRKRIGAYRLAAELGKQEQLAGRWTPTEKKKEFVTPQYLGMLLRGEQDDPRKSILVALAKYFGCSIDDLAEPTADQAELLARLQRAGLQDISMRVAALPPDAQRTLRTMLDRIENDDDAS
jgi:transcriptional regulator with XRE-family HTH domain